MFATANKVGTALWLALLVAGTGAASAARGEASAAATDAAAASVAAPVAGNARARVPNAEEICAVNGAPDNGPPRRRPGQNDDTPRLEYELPPCDPHRVPQYTARVDLGPPVPDRWRIMDAFYRQNVLDPYANNNWLKGDKPVFGTDWFVSLLAVSDTVVEPRDFPVPVGTATTTRRGRLQTIGNGKSLVLAQSIILEGVLLKGDTVFRPPDYEFRFTPVINYTNVLVRERGLLKVDPGGADYEGRRRTETFIGIQAAFVDKHLRNTSDRFDFDSVRVGIQPFSSDFRGFLFQDSQLGIRVFGNRDNNIFQYNLAWFRLLEKDTNSGLNDIAQALRKNDVFVANLYWQDFPHVGFTSQATVLYNRDREKNQRKYDQNGFLARPASVFEERARDFDIVYIGYNGDGHFGRLNLTTSLYYAGGTQTSTRFNNADEDVSAWFFAAEASRDFNWVRVRGSLLYATGDNKPLDKKATGFDAVFENPQFAGADTSYWIRQTVPLIGGGGVILSGRNGVLNTVRSSKEQGQSNFINPGTVLAGIGADFDLLPHLRVSVNANGLWFDKTQVLERLRQQAPIDKFIGEDVSVAVIWRPFVTQNLVFRLSAAALIPGSGFDQLYGNKERTPYSILGNFILQY